MCRFLRRPPKLWMCAVGDQMLHRFFIGIAIHYNTLQHTRHNTDTHYNTLQHAVKHIFPAMNMRSGRPDVAHTLYRQAVQVWVGVGGCESVAMSCVWCSVLQYVAVCCSVLQCVVVCCSMLQCAAVCCSVLQCVVVCCSVLYSVVICCSLLDCVAAGAVWCSVVQHGAVWCSVVQCVAVCCSVLQCVAMLITRVVYCTRIYMCVHVANYNRTCVSTYTHTPVYTQIQTRPDNANAHVHTQWHMYVYPLYTHITTCAHAYRHTPTSRMAQGAVVYAWCIKHIHMCVSSYTHAHTGIPRQY